MTRRRVLSRWAGSKKRLLASGCELVTVALRRVDLDKNPEGDPLISKLDPGKVVIVPNTSGARTAEEAIRIARLARAAGGFDWIKLELTPNLHHLLPDPIETLKAAEVLVKEGFKVLPYINADPVLAKRLEEAGTVAVMPLAAPIGSNLGIRTRDMLEIIVANARVPVVVDAGLGMPLPRGSGHRTRRGLRAHQHRDRRRRRPRGHGQGLRQSRRSRRGGFGRRPARAARLCRRLLAAHRLPLGKT